MAKRQRRRDTRRQVRAIKEGPTYPLDHTDEPDVDLEELYDDEDVSHEELARREIAAFLASGEDEWAPR